MKSRFGLTILAVVVLVGGSAGCSSNQSSDLAQTSGTDPADSNFAMTDTTAPAAQPQLAPGAPAATTSYSNYSGAATDYGQAPANYPAYQDAPEFSGQAEYATAPPPPIPDYSQPECPGPNYIWTPGYWSYTDTGYYWVPGAWVLAPYVDALWTPPYWAYDGGRYRWHAGYWGPHIGYYGGINYGFGYTGNGYFGGYWNQGQFDYNRSVNNVNASVVRNVYQHPVRNFTSTRVSYNGGPGGVNARPTPAEMAAEREPRIAPVAAQITHAREAAADKSQFASVNHGRPAVAAAPRPLAVNYRAPSAPSMAVQRTIRPVAPAARPARGNDVRAQLQPAERPEVARQNVPERGPAPEVRPAPQARPMPEARQEPAGRPAPKPAVRQNMPVARPEPAARPQPFARPQQEARPQPGARPQEVRPVPAARPAPRPEPAARPEARPQPVARPEPAARPQPAARPAPAAHAAPAPRKEEEKR